jgi:hypothetical protein
LKIKCQEIVTVFHGIKENYEDCNKCEQRQTMKKLLSVPFIAKKEIANNLNTKIGDVTNEYIEINREILEQQKEEGKKTDYEPT